MSFEILFFCLKVESEILNKNQNELLRNDYLIFQKKGRLPNKL